MSTQSMEWFALNSAPFCVDYTMQTVLITAFVLLWQCSDSCLLISLVDWTLPLPPPPSPPPPPRRVESLQIQTLHQTIDLPCTLVYLGRYRPTTRLVTENIAHTYFILAYDFTNLGFSSSSIKRRLVTGRKNVLKPFSIKCLCSSL